MTHDDALRQAVLADPDADAPRLVYADWLEEHGDPDRAEFIRAQCQLARLPEGDPNRVALEKQAAALLKAHAKEWMRPWQQALNRRCAQLDRGWEFKRGFLHRLPLSPRRLDFLSAAAAVLAREPVEVLQVTGHSDLGLDRVMEAVAAAPLGCLRFLYLLGAGTLTAPLLNALGCSSNLPRLTELGLSHTVPTVTLAGLVGTPLAQRLRVLSLFVAPGDIPALLGVLTGSPVFPALTSLGLYRERLGEDGLARLAHTPHLPALAALNLSDADVGPRALDVLRASPLWGRLTELSLDRCPPDEAAVARLATALPGSRLRTLRLAYSGLTQASAAALAGAPSWGALDDLSLDGNRLGDAGVIALAGTPHLAQLRSLNVYSCGLGDAGARALAGSPYAAGLRRVQLYESNFPLGAQRALRKRFGPAFHFGH